MVANLIPKPRQSVCIDLVLLARAVVWMSCATLQDNPSMTADGIRTIVTGGGQTVEFMETTAHMPRAVKTLAASVIMNHA